MLKINDIIFNYQLPTIALQILSDLSAGPKMLNANVVLGNARPALSEWSED